MLPPLEQQEEEAQWQLEELEEVPDGAPDSGAAEGGYECKYCSFQTPELNLFTVHVDTQHPDMVLNTSYVCLECDYHTRRYSDLCAGGCVLFLL